MMRRWWASSGARVTSWTLSMVAPRSDSYPAVMPRVAPRRSTSVQLTFVKSARVSVQPPKLTRRSVAPPNSTSRSRQFSNVTSVSVPLRKFTESSLPSRNVTRRIEAEKACTPASAQPVSVVSCQPVSARSLATNLVSRSRVSVNRDFLSRPPSKAALTNSQSRKWQWLAAVSPNEASANRTPSYSSSGSRPPSCGVSSPAMDRPYRRRCVRLPVPGGDPRRLLRPAIAGRRHAAPYDPAGRAKGNQKGAGRGRRRGLQRKGHRGVPGERREGGRLVRGPDPPAAAPHRSQERHRTGEPAGLSAGGRQLRDIRLGRRRAAGPAVVPQPGRAPRRHGRGGHRHDQRPGPGGGPGRAGSYLCQAAGSHVQFRRLREERRAARDSRRPARPGGVTFFSPALAADVTGWPPYAPGRRTTTRIFDDPPVVAPHPERASLHIWDQHRFGTLDLTPDPA